MLRNTKQQFYTRICALRCHVHSDDDCTRDTAPLSSQTEQIRCAVYWKYGPHVEERILTEDALGKCWNSVLTELWSCVQPLNSFLYIFFIPQYVTYVLDEASLNE
jgi:hypothetical protein